MSSEVVSARTMRRHWNLLSKVAEKVLSIGYNLQTHRNETANLREEFGERLRVIENDLEQIRKYVGVIAQRSDGQVLHGHAPVEVRLPR